MTSHVTDNDAGSRPDIAARLDAIVKAYDVRGLYPEQLDEEMAFRLGAAVGDFFATTEIVVGRDTRPSGESLVEAFSDGVRSRGTAVADVGIVSTDLVYFASGHLNVPGAMFTASHNPAGYNGLKLCGPGAAPISSDTGLDDIKRHAAGSSGASGCSSAPRREIDLVGAFADHVRSFVNPASLAGLRIVADTANGAGGVIVPAVFDGLGVEVELLYGELDGTFPNHPADPIQPENLVDLQARVLAAGAHAGLAFDGDADRVFLVDETARPVSGSLTTAIVAQRVLRANPGATVLYNLICSRVVPEVIAESGGTGVRTRVGHSFIKAVMAQSGAIFGGEHSGHYYFRDNYRADSGIIAALMVLEALGEGDTSLRALCGPFDRYVQSGELNFRVESPTATTEAIADSFADLPQDRLDGLTVDGGPWWFNVRASNTEPLLRLNVEAPDADVLATVVSRVQSLIATEPLSSH